MLQCKYRLGDKVKDTITGFEGIAVAITFWLNGCTRISVQKEKLDEKGLPANIQCFDEPQLVLINEKIYKKGDKLDGPMPKPTQNITPKRQ